MKSEEIEIIGSLLVSWNYKNGIAFGTEIIIIAIEIPVEQDRLIKQQQ